MKTQGKKGIGNGLGTPQYDRKSYFWVSTPPSPSFVSVHPGLFTPSLLPPHTLKPLIVGMPMTSYGITGPYIIAILISILVFTFTVHRFEPTTQLPEVSCFPTSVSLSLF